MKAEKKIIKNELGLLKLAMRWDHPRNLIDGKRKPRVEPIRRFGAHPGATPGAVENH